jgi:hypothetical protein
VDESWQDHEIANLFRDLNRSECLFEHRQPAVEEPTMFDEDSNLYLYPEAAPRTTRRVSTGPYNTGVGSTVRSRC